MKTSGLLRRVPRRVAVLIGAAAVVMAVARPEMQGGAYAVYTSEGQRALSYQTARNVDFVPLQQVADLFGLTLAEDTLVGGLTVGGRGQTILLIPGQSFASIGRNYF